jgi:Family of unknown function (DUF6644)
MDVLMTWAKWLETSPWGYPVRTSLWLYPFIQLIHFSGLSLWIGTSVAMDLRLMGVGSRRQTAAQLHGQLFAWNWIGFGVVVLGGFLLFSASATTFLENAAFLVKLEYLVPLALIWHIFVQIQTPNWGQRDSTPVPAKLAGALEICLWLGVVTAAVLIPTY